MKSGNWEPISACRQSFPPTTRTNMGALFRLGTIPFPETSYTCGHMSEISAWLVEPLPEDVICVNCQHPLKTHGEDGFSCDAELEDDTGAICGCSVFEPWDSQPFGVCLPADATLDQLTALLKMATAEGRMAPPELSRRIREIRGTGEGLTPVNGQCAEAVNRLIEEALRTRTRFEQEIEGHIAANRYEDALLVLRSLPVGDRKVAERIWLCLSSLGKHEEALETMKANPCDSAAEHGRMAFTYLNLEAWDAAAACARASFDLIPSAWALEMLARAAIRGLPQHKWTPELRSEVQSLLRPALDLSDCAESTYLFLLDAESWPSVREGAEETTIDLLRRGVTAFPESQELRERLAMRLDLSTSAKEIVKVLGPVLTSNPPPFIRVCASDAYFEINCPDEAVRQIESLETNSDRQFDEKNLLLADIYLRAGAFGKAIDAFRSGGSSATPSTRFYSAIGEATIAFSSGESEAGLLHFRSACSIFFEEPKMDRWCLHYMYPFESERDSHLREVCELVSAHFEKCRSLDPEVASALTYFRWAYESLRSEKTLNGLLEAFTIYPHPKFRGDLSWIYRDLGDIKKSVQHHLEHALWVVQKSDAAQPGTYYPPTGEIPKRTALSVQRAAMALLKRHANETTLARVFWPFYRSFLRDLHFKAERYTTILEILTSLNLETYGTERDFWDYAYAAHCAGNFETAEKAYRGYLERFPDSASALYNCALVVRQLGRLDEALLLVDQAHRHAPEHENTLRLKTQIEAAIADRNLDRERKDGALSREREKRDDFFKTAPERWSQVDYYKRQVLSALSVIRGFDDWPALARMSGVGEQYLPGHWRKLVELGMIIEQPDGKYEVNEHVLPLVKLERSHALMTQVVRAEPRIAFKPIFNSRLEYTIYNVLTRLFPNQLVFPNMSLQTVFQYDRMKDLLTCAEFGYYLRAQVDFCITSTASYLPILCIEVDSQFHDDLDQQARDAMKNRIFATGGVPLIRARPYGKPTEGAIREQLCETLRAFGGQIRQTEEQAGAHVNVLLEIDFSAFGLEAQAPV